MYDKKNNNAGAVICAVNNHEKDYSTVAEPNITTDEHGSKAYLQDQILWCNTSRRVIIVIDDV